ncbi:MAG: M48 family metallopeptidase [Nitrospirae bacterium]|nr:M48 family metallopeptidase [Nitrospirota bacterium]
MIGTDAVGVAGAGLCFGAGLASQGERVPFEVGSERLVLWPKSSREHGVPYQAIHLDPGGFDRRHIQLRWAEDGVAWALVLDDERLAKAVRTHPPDGLRGEVERLGARFARGRVMSGLGWSLVAAVVLVPVVALGVLWWQADRIVDAAVGRIPVSWEERLGESAFSQVAAGATVLTTGPAVEAVEGIGARLTASVESPYTFRWHVVDDAQVNAFAVPGGHVVVFTGLIRAAESGDELAGVLAHEIQHVVLRHSLRGLVRTMGWRAALSILFGNTGSLAGVGELASRLGSLKFSRDQETAADLGGLALLRRARIDPRGMIAFFDTLAKEEHGRVAFLSTHPVSTERAARLRAEVENSGAWPTEPFPYAWTDVKASVGTE